MSHPVWVRGLKPLYRHVSQTTFRVAPCVGAWIETLSGIGNAVSGASHPVWVRGLKHHLIDEYRQRLKSHPVWVRGLKPW